MCFQYNFINCPSCDFYTRDEMPLHYFIYLKLIVHPIVSNEIYSSTDSKQNSHLIYFDKLHLLNMI